MGRLPGERADRQRQLRRPRHRHGFIEEDPDPNRLAHAVGVAALGAGKESHLRHDRGAVDTPVHLVACSVRDGLAAQIQRCGVAARILNRAAIQRQGVSRDADPVRVGVPGLCSIDELQPLPACIGWAIVRLTGERADRQRQLRRAGHRDGFVEFHTNPDVLLSAVGVPTPGGGIQNYGAYGRGIIRAAVHLAVPIVGDGVRAEIQSGVVAVGVPNRAAVQRQRVRGNADAVRIAVRCLDGISEDQGRTAASVRCLAGVRPDRQRQLWRAGHGEGFIEPDPYEDSLVQPERVAALRSFEGDAAHRRRGGLRPGDRRCACKGDEQGEPNGQEAAETTDTGGRPVSVSGGGGIVGSLGWNDMHVFLSCCRLSGGEENQVRLVRVIGISSARRCTGCFWLPFPRKNTPFERAGSLVDNAS